MTEPKLILFLEAGFKREPTAYEQEFDKAAADTSTPWLPPAPQVEDTLTERGKNYGDFTDNAAIAQHIKEVMLDSPMWYVIEDEYIKEALQLIASKIGRLLSGNPYHADGWHDIAGYATLVEQLINKRSK